MSLVISSSVWLDGFVIDASVVRYRDTLSPVWSSAGTSLVENPQLIDPAWLWGSSMKETHGYPRTGKVQRVKSDVKLI